MGSNPSFGSSLHKLFRETWGDRIAAIAADCKSAPSGSVVRVHLLPLIFIITAEVAQLVEHQPSKLRVASSNLVFRSEKGNLKSRCSSGVERILGKDEVMSSNPITGSIFMY